MSKPFEKSDANEQKSGISHKNSGISDLNLFIKMRKYEAEQNKALQGKKNQQELISDMTRNALTNNQPETERKEALDALHLNDGFFQEKGITIQKALKEHTDALKSLKETDSHLETAKSLHELYKNDISSLKNATPEQIDKTYTDINKSLENLDAIKAKLDILDYAKKYMSKGIISIKRGGEGWVAGHEKDGPTRA